MTQKDHPISQKIIHKILIIDDNTAIHEDFKAIFNAQIDSNSDSELNSLEEELLGSPKRKPQLFPKYSLSSAYSGQEGVEKVRQAMTADSPFSLIFLDIRMPPGMDGIETAEKIWSLDPEVQIVLCSAYSDYSWEDLLIRLNNNENLLFLQKPFHIVAVQQIASTMIKKRTLADQKRSLIKDMEATIRHRTAELESLLEQQTALKKKAQKADDSKSQFLSHMSHEIRTPLNGIMGMTDLLMTTDMTTEQTSYVELLKNSAESLLLIVNDILDYSRIEAGRLNVEERSFDLIQLLDNLVDINAIKAQEKGIEVEHIVATDVPRIMVGDSQRLGQIILNLLNNAVKFTYHGKIQLETRILNREKNGTAVLEISITDTGIGIAPEKREKLFKPFVQAGRSINREFGGSGLGLAISRALSRLMNGDLRLENPTESGSRFICTVELRLPPEEPQKREPPLNREIIVCTKSDLIKEKISSEGKRESFCPIFCSSPDEIPSTGKSRWILVDMISPQSPCYLSLRQVAESLGPEDQLWEIAPRHTRKPKAANPLFNGRICTPIRGDELRKAILQSPDPQHKKCQFRAIRENQKRILIAEDNKTNQILLQKMLNRLGQDADIASNGKISLKMWKEKNYDLILMDCSMPEMNGYETTRAIRKDESGSTIPIIAITANAFEENKRECLEAGMTDFLSKPFTIDNLRSILDTHLPKEK